MLLRDPRAKLEASFGNCDCTGRDSGDELHVCLLIAIGERFLIASIVLVMMVATTLEQGGFPDRRQFAHHTSQAICFVAQHAQTRTQLSGARTRRS